MRRISVMMAALILLLSEPSFAQEWIQYASRTDFFGVNFPGEPKVQDITYPTEYGITLPGRVYSVENGPNRYSVTVVNYADAEKIHTTRAEQCRRNGGEGDACQNDWRVDVQGSIVYAAWHPSLYPRGDRASGCASAGAVSAIGQFLDDEGKPVRYRSYYTTGYSEEWKFPAPPPPRAR